MVFATSFAARKRSSTAQKKARVAKGSRMVDGAMGYIEHTSNIIQSIQHPLCDVLTNMETLFTYPACLLVDEQLV